MNTTEVEKLVLRPETVKSAEATVAAPPEVRPFHEVARNTHPDAILPR